MRYVTHVIIFFLAAQTNIHASSLNANGEDEGWTLVTPKPMSKTQQAKLAQKEAQTRLQHEQLEKKRAQKEIEAAERRSLEREKEECNKQAEILWAEFIGEIRAGAPIYFNNLHNRRNRLKSAFVREAERRYWLKKQTKLGGREQVLAGDFRFRTFLDREDKAQALRIAARASKKFCDENEQVKAAAAAIPTPDIRSVSEFPPLS